MTTAWLKERRFTPEDRRIFQSLFGAEVELSRAALRRLAGARFPLCLLAHRLLRADQANQFNRALVDLIPVREDALALARKAKNHESLHDPEHAGANWERAYEAAWDTFFDALADALADALELTGEGVTG